MSRILKYELNLVGETVLNIPIYSEILAIKEQYNKPVVWLLVDEEQPIGELKFTSVLTGNDLPDNASVYCYIDTVLIDNGSFVMHFFVT